jgi:hypothetical protein
MITINRIAEVHLFFVLIIIIASSGAWVFVIGYWVLAIGYGIASLYLIKLIEFLPSTFDIRYSIFVILFFRIPAGA